jgi:hypothetical protein
MAQRRGLVVGWSGTLAGLGVAGATLIATVGKKPVSNPWFIAFVVVAAIGFILFVLAGLPDLAGWIAGGARGLRQIRRRPPRLITETWRYTADGARAPAANSATELLLPGTGYRMQPGERRAWVRFVVLVPCSHADPTADAQLYWPDFQQFLLKKQPVTSLVNSFTRGVPGLVWTRWHNPRGSVIDALLTPGTEDEAVASARLELPDNLPRQGRDPRYAQFILHFEPAREPASAEQMQADAAIPLPSVGPVAWTDHMLRALELAKAVAQFLSRELGLTTPGDPPVVVGFRLEAQHDLAELIDVSGLNELPGGRHRVQAIGYFVSDPDGMTAERVVQQMITDVLRYGLGAERMPVA